VNRSEQSRVAPRPTVKKVTSRTSSDRQRAKVSPLARAVNQKNTPKATRIFIYTTATLAVLTITLMMVVVVFQTRLAETQLNIDAIEKQISVERARYDELRLQRSALREPSRLVSEASALGMVPGSKTNFNTVDPSAVASVLVSLGGVDLEQFANTRDPLKNYSAVKALIGDGS
jgi:cell division protein FtsL